MTTQAAQGTGPAVSSFTPRHAAPSLRRAVQRWDSRPSHPCSKFSHHHSNYPSPTTLRPRPAEAKPHMCPPQCRFPLDQHSLSVTGPGPHGCSVVARRRHCCSTPQPLSHSRRPDWPGAALAPAQPGAPGALSGSLRLRILLRGRLSQCLMAGFSGSLVATATDWPWVLKVLENEAALL